MPQRPPRKGRPLHLKTSGTWRPREAANTRHAKLSGSREHAAVGNTRNRGTHGIGKHTESGSTRHPRTVESGKKPARENARRLKPRGIPANDSAPARSRTQKKRPETDRLVVDRGFEPLCRA